MATFDVPSINVSDKTNEENMQAVKSHLYNLSDNLNYYINNLESRISTLENLLNEKGE